MASASQKDNLGKDSQLPQLYDQHSPPPITATNQPLTLHGHNQPQPYHHHRNEEGKLVFAKKLPRVATIAKPKEAFLSQLALQTQKQKIFEQAFVRYPECRSTVFAPSSWDPRNIHVEQLEMPAMNLRLKRAHGYHPHPHNSNVFYLPNGDMIWCTAALVVLAPPPSSSCSQGEYRQRFFCGHTKEVTALTHHHHIIASGQAVKAADHVGIYVWDSQSHGGPAIHADHSFNILARLQGHTSTIRSISFSHDGKLLASLGSDMYNTICIHDWKDQTCLVKARCHNYLKAVHCVAFNPYQAYGLPDKVMKRTTAGKKDDTGPFEYRAKPGQALRDEHACYTLVTCGVQHIKFWTLTQAPWEPPSTLEKVRSQGLGMKRF